MVRNALRTELSALLRAPEGSRAPALRRSLRADWLYAADLPALYGGNLPEELPRRLKDAGWVAEPDGGWLQLRKPAPEPPEGWYGGSFGPEAACCLSLLERHRPCDGDPEPAQRTLIKAGEEGPEAYEAACASLHRDWAECLRRGETLPDLSQRYFGA